MRVVWSLFLSALLLVAGLAYAQNDVQPYQIDKQATAQAPWKVGDIVAEKEINQGEVNARKIYRKFMGVTSKGDFVVQDFYQQSNRRFSSAIAITQQDFVDDITKSYITHPLDGMLVIWYENGQKQLEVQYQDGEEQGRWTIWYSNGQKQGTGLFQNGKENGLFTTWYDNGQKAREGMFQEGKEQGLWTTWYDNGQKASEGQYQDGGWQGLWTTWQDNGQKRLEGQYQDGEEQGLWTNWDCDGKKISEMVFEAGKLISERTFD